MYGRWGVLGEMKGFYWEVGLGLQVGECVAGGRL